MSALSFFERYAPALAARYLERRLRLDSLKRLYEAAQASAYHRPRSQMMSGDAVVDHAGHKLVAHSRWLDENHDVAVGILDTLVNRTVGTGLVPSPMVRMRDGTLHEAVNTAIQRLVKTWAKAPDTTRENALGELQRLQARTWFRDGEVLLQHLQGGGFDHRGPVPYTVEVLERDYLPMDMTGRSPARVVHGVEKAPGGRPVAYHLLREHPGDVGLTFTANRETIRIPADRIEHLKYTRRLRQTRGVPVFHAVIRRLEDIKDYEESERIAARVAAAFTGYIKKGGDYAGSSATTTSRQMERQMEMNPGMIFDNLLPGEEIGTIGSNRPNTGLAAYVQDQHRRLAAGTGTSASTISRNYTDGSYSAQRQEMVEIEPSYARLFEYFVCRSVTPMYERLVETAVLSGALTLPRNVDLETLFDIEVSRPVSPWIDPAKEVAADAEAVAAGFKSRHQVIRERNGDPRRVDAEITADTFRPQGAEPPAPASADSTDPDTDDEEAQAA